MSQKNEETKSTVDSWCSESKNNFEGKKSVSRYLLFQIHNNYKLYVIPYLL